MITYFRLLHFLEFSQTGQNFKDPFVHSRLSQMAPTSNGHSTATNGSLNVKFNVDDRSGHISTLNLPSSPPPKTGGTAAVRTIGGTPGPNGHTNVYIPVPHRRPIESSADPDELMGRKNNSYLSISDLLQPLMACLPCSVVIKKVIKDILYFCI